MLELFPDSATIQDGELSLGGLRTTQLAKEFGTPLVVYCAETIRANAREFRSAAGDALVVYGTKAFANVALLKLLADEGIGADVSTLGELTYAQRAGIPAGDIVFHGNNKSDDELRAAAQSGVLVVLDAQEELERARTAGVQRALIRLRPGIAADTHASIATAHAQSKFGLDAEQALAVIAAATGNRPAIVGVHVHIGSQLTRPDESVAAVNEVVAFCARARDELDWNPHIVDLGGGLGVRHARTETVPSINAFTAAILSRFRDHGPAGAQLILEPGRSLIGRAGMSLYRVGATKRSADVDYVAIDGGMSDNPRPQLYGARYEPLLATRADEKPSGVYRIAGKHCESGDVLVEAASLPKPERGDLIAVPATGAYTLAMSSTYNGVPRPAVVLVEDASARLIRRRETVDDLLMFEHE